MLPGRMMTADTEIRTQVRSHIALMMGQVLVLSLKLVRQQVLVAGIEVVGTVVAAGAVVVADLSHVFLWSDSDRVLLTDCPDGQVASKSLILVVLMVSADRNVHFDCESRIHRKVTPQMRQIQAL